VYRVWTSEEINEVLGLYFGDKSIRSIGKATGRTDKAIETLLAKLFSSKLYHVRRIYVPQRKGRTGKLNEREIAVVRKCGYEWASVLLVRSRKELEEAVQRKTSFRFVD